MRIVFTGTSGTDKRHVIDEFANHIRQKGRRVYVIEAEDRLYKQGKDKFYEFLDSVPGSKAARLWSESVKDSIDGWNQIVRTSGEPDFTLLSIHVIYHVRSHFFCPMNWSFRNGDTVSGELLEILKQFDPHLFVNLIDNVYALQKRIKDYPFRLIELLRWRNVEALMTDILANLVIDEKDRIRERADNASHFKYERSPIVAVRHSRDMLYRLIADETGKRIYMAYPISEPRRVHKKTGDDRLMRQVNSFRNYMRNQFVAFDPVTIDERPLKFLWEDFVKRKSSLLKNKKLTKGHLIREVRSLISGHVDLALTEEDTWPTVETEYSQMLCGPLDWYRSRLSNVAEGATADKPITLKLNAGEVRSVVEEKQFWAGTQKGGEIDNQIVRRDYRLIDQADCVVIYRPTMKKPGGWQLGGTRLEYEYAKNSGKPALVIRDKKDGPLEDAPFNTNVNPFDILEWSGLDSPNDRTREERQQSCFAEATALVNQKISDNFKGL